MKKQPFRHKHFSDAEAQLRDVLANHRPGRLVGICGMPGSGKTFLRNLVLREIVGNPNDWGTGRLSVTEVMALLDINSRFSSKGFAARSHRSVLRPDLRALYRDESDEIQTKYLASLRHAEKAWVGSRIAATTSESSYWRSFSDAAIDRQLKYFLVEHAAAIGKSPRDEEPGDHIWNLMSILEEVGCMGILNLIPEGYMLWEGRPEIAERMDRVYIKPYNVLDKSEITEFARLVLDVANRYVLESMDVVTNHIVEIGIATATSIRPVEELFARALVTTKNRGAEKIGIGDLMRAMDTREHVASLWAQVGVLNSISKPANRDELLAIHQSFVAEH